MTKENQIIRDKLKAAEHIITTALASQPEDDALCKAHLKRAVREVCEKVVE